MALKDEIELIINRRKAKIPEIEKKYNKVAGLNNAIEDVQRLKNEILDNVERMNIAPDVKARIQAVDITDFSTAFQKFDKQYREVIARFSRDEINIAVVGAARQGKSLLLQSISNLDNKVIPAFQADDCTGTTSIIKNVPGSEISAQINFMTETQMVECVQKYLSDIFGDSERLDSFNGIRSLDIERLRAKMKKGSSKSAKFEHLVKYIRYFDKWSENVGKGYITVTNADDIQKYVAQHNGKNESSSERVDYYAYLAVKDVIISCQFRNKDAGKVVLRDTIGLGDTSLGIKDKMIAAIRDNSDAAIIVRRPEAGTGKLDEVDNEIYNILYEAFDSRNNMDKWLFWIVNNTSSDSIYGDNKERCEAFEKKVDELKWNLAGRYIVDVSDESAVNDIFSNQILNTLTKNIDDIDAGIMLELNEQIGRLFNEYKNILAAIENILDAECEGRVDKGEFIDKKWRGFYDQTFMKALKDYRNELFEKKDVDCEEFKKHVNRILDNAIDLVPSVQTIVKDLLSGGKNRTVDIYPRYLDKMRSDFTEKFINVDELIFDGQVKEFKEKIIDIFSQDDCGRLKYVVPVDKDKKLGWLRDAAETLFNMNRYSQFKIAFIMLDNFELTVRGFLMHRIRSRIDRFDLEKQSEINVPEGNEDVVARYINGKLEKKCREVCEEIRSDMENGFYSDPNRMLYAVMAEFYDRINFSYTDNMQEVSEVWKGLYRDNCQEIWKDEFRSSMQVTDLYNRWSNLIEHLKKYKKDEILF